MQGSRVSVPATAPSLWHTAAWSGRGGGGRNPGSLFLRPTQAGMWHATAWHGGGKGSCGAKALGPVSPQQPQPALASPRALPFQQTWLGHATLQLLQCNCLRVEGWGEGSPYHVDLGYSPESSASKLWGDPYGGLGEAGALHGHPCIAMFQVN